MLILYDISIFMIKFLNEVVRIFKFTFDTLQSIEFMGTNLLQVLLTIYILGAILPVFLTIINNQGVKAEKRAYKNAREEKRKARSN
jgi:hypothetical protein